MIYSVCNIFHWIEKQIHHLWSSFLYFKLALLTSTCYCKCQRLLIEKLAADMFIVFVRQPLLDALTACGSENCIILLTDLIRNKELEEGEIYSFLTHLALIPHPSPQIIGSINVGNLHLKFTSKLQCSRLSYFSQTDLQYILFVLGFTRSPWAAVKGSARWIVSGLSIE